MLTWMAWTLETTLFFCFIAGALVCMTIWELRRPGGAPRQGILGLTTTRGDRLFISLVGSAYINLAWLGLVPAVRPGGVPLGLDRSPARRMGAATAFSKAGFGGCL